MFRIVIAILLLSISIVGFADPSNSIMLDESSITEMSKKANPSSQAFLAKQKQTEMAEAQFETQYQSEFFTDLAYSKSNTIPAVLQAPTFSPTESIALGMRKNLPLGMQTSLSIFSSQQTTSNNSVVRSNSSGIRASVSMDIWNNLLGRLNNFQSSSLAYQKQRALIRHSVDQKMFEIGLRKLYWSLVSNEEQLKMTKQILKTAVKQSSEARRRLNASIGTRADVAKFAARVSGHNATITALNYQKAAIILNLKKLLPELNGKNVSLGKYDYDAMITKVLTCTKTIKAQKSVPWDYTQYDEMVALLENQFNQDSLLDNSKNSADLRVFADGEYSGRGNEYSGAIEEFQDEPRFAYAVGLALTVPVGNEKERAVEATKAYRNALINSQRSELMAAAESRHSQMLPMVDLLYQAVIAREKSGADLQVATKETQKMYAQARVSLDSVILEENALFANRIEEIATKKLVIDELLDYFQIFNQTPCALNNTNGGK